jgi:hypothetical protein
VPTPREYRPRALLALTIACALIASSCESAVNAYATDQTAARTKAAQVATSVQHRFEQPLRDARYGYARMRIARYALAPSKVEDDTIWTRRVGATRELSAAGRLVDGRYHFAARDVVPMPSAVGESRHFIALDTLADGDRRWRTQVDQSIGSAMPSDIAAVFTALMRSAERSADDIRADYRRTMPRTSSAFAQLATLDSVRTTRLADGSTLVALGIQLHPDRIATTYPDFAKFLRKYVSPARYRFTLRDEAAVGVHANDTWFIAEGKNDLVTLRFRSHNGALQPLEGPLRDRPDTLAIHVDASAKFGPFTVGVRDMRGRFVFLQGANERGWDFRFRQAPDWDLPPIAGRLVRSPLNRPFEGSGVHARLSIRRLANGQSVIHRSTEVAVRESAVVRWLGNLGFTAMDDFAGRVEMQEAQFIASAMQAMRQDLGALPASR